MSYYRSSGDFGFNQKPDFNMAIIFLERLNKRLDERDINSANGNMLGWYRLNRIIFRNIFFKVKEKGHEAREEELNQLFDKAKNYLSADQTSSKALNKQMETIAITRIEELLDKIDLILNDLMFEYGLIFPKRKEKDPSRAVEDMF